MVKQTKRMSYQDIDVDEEFAKFETGVEKVDKIIMGILKEIPYVDIKPYSHNIISCDLRHLKKLGHNEIALDIIERTPLMDLGWGHIVKKERNKNRTELVSMEELEKLSPEDLDKLIQSEEYKKKSLSLL